MSGKTLKRLWPQGVPNRSELLIAVVRGSAAHARFVRIADLRGPPTHSRTAARTISWTQRHGVDDLGKVRLSMNVVDQAAGEAAKADKKVA